MNAIGGQEMLFPALLPREPYELTDRWAEEHVSALAVLKAEEVVAVLLPASQKNYPACSLML